ncbi:hypothetical protein [Burkholderia cepacia]|uniref:hypothetical protein n=1 Tax=Burkholderia cepacia TaxID=292 RepID=UPI001589766A|nr:hypothetical protein [Burkholderia cepacia]
MIPGLLSVVEDLVSFSTKEGILVAAPVLAGALGALLSRATKRYLRDEVAEKRDIKVAVGDKNVTVLTTEVRTKSGDSVRLTFPPGLSDREKYKALEELLAANSKPDK